MEPAVALSRESSKKSGLPWRAIFLNVFVTVLTAAILLLGHEAYNTWQRVGAMWVWVNNQEQARLAAMQQQQPSSAAKALPMVESPQSGKK